MSREWFAVDRKGLAKLLRRKGIEFAVFELIQNAWDEDGVTEVDVTLEHVGGMRAMLTITDDAPAGFKDLAHAFTLFAESAKKSDATRRGRFNLGEKLVLSLCERAEVQSTTGTVRFKEGVGRTTNRNQKRERGTSIVMLIKMTKAEVERVGERVWDLIPPRGIATLFNGAEIQRPEMVCMFTDSLPTEIADAEGVLRPARRVTAVRCYPVKEGEAARIYEIGIPVVEHECAFHVDVAQKIPLTIDRENVTPKFLRELHTAVYNHTHDKVDAEQTKSTWTQTAVESADVDGAAVRDYVTKRFGEKRVSYDVSDPEANNRAVSNGYTLVTGGMLSGAAWKNVRGFKEIQPAGKVFPTHPGSRVPFEQAEITGKMIEVEQYAKRFATLTIGHTIAVAFGKQRTREAACYGARRLQFNVTNLGADWFDLSKNREAIDDLIIHELGHEFESNHLSDRYYSALTRIAAKAIQAVREGNLCEGAF